MAVLFLLMLLVLSTSAGPTSNKTEKGTREGKVFSLFSIVQFPNEGCTSTSSTYNNGTCFTASECSSKGGSAMGNCAAGFGVCCVFSVSASGSTVSTNCSYIVNPSYPSNYAPTSTPATVTYTIQKCSTDICRIRLDYESMVLTQPSTTAATLGQCATESLTIATTGQPTVPAAGSVGFYPYLCGTNTGYHSYIDMSQTSDDTATLTFTLGDAVTNQWKIKLTQYSCNDDYVAAQSGCFQYFTGLTGTVQSYNYPTSQITAQAWKGCVRQEEGYCCIQWSVSGTPAISYQMTDGTCADAANSCAGNTLCGAAANPDFITIPGGGLSTTGVPTVQASTFCGLNLNAGGFPAINVPVISCTQPFEIGHTTDITATDNGGAVGNIGFQLTYTQLAAGC